jgi:hypothetical protein
MKKSWHQLSTSLQSDVMIYARPNFNDQDMIFRQPNWGRSMVIAEESGNRLPAKRGLVKAITIRKRISGYPSHEVVIDRDEASEIFSRIRPPGSEEQQLVDLLKPLCDAALMPTGKPLIDQLDFSDDASVTSHSSSEPSDAPNTAAECNRASESSGGARDTSGKVVEGPAG